MLPGHAAIEKPPPAALYRFLNAIAARGATVTPVVDAFLGHRPLSYRQIDTHFALRGLCSVRPIGHSAQTRDLAPTLFPHRRAILNERRKSGGALHYLVAQVIAHEVTPHFGLGDAQIDAVGGGAW